MVILGLLLACGDKETTDNTDTGIEDTAVTEDTATNDTGVETDNTEETDTTTDTDTEETQDTEDTEDTQNDTDDQDPQWFEAGVYTGTYTCDDGFNPYHGIPMIDVKSTGQVSEIEVLNTTATLTWECSITEAHDTAETEWGVTCTGENTEFFSSAKVYSQGFKMDLNLLFSAGPYGILMCNTSFE